MCVLYSVFVEIKCSRYIVGHNTAVGFTAEEGEGGGGGGEGGEGMGEGGKEEGGE